LALRVSEEEDRFTTTETGAASLAALASKVEETTLAKERGLRKEEVEVKGVVLILIQVVVHQAEELGLVMRMDYQLIIFLMVQ
jgi:hypothetical protein